MTITRYRSVLSRPEIRRVVATALVARAPNAMASLAMVLLVSPRHGYGLAGLAVGAHVGLTCVSAPVLSRLAISRGARPVLVTAAIGFAACMVALAVVPRSSYAALLAACAGAGLCVPPVVAVVRGLWPRLSTPEDVQVLYGLEATAQEAIFIVGPAFVALLAAAAGASTAAVVTGVIGLVGTIALVASPVFDGYGGGRTRARHRLLRGSRLPLYVAIAFTLTVMFNMCDIGVVAFVSGRRANAAAGFVLASWSAGSMLGGLLFGGRGGVADERSVAGGSLAIAASIAAAAAAPGRVGLAAVLFIGGMTIAPGLARLYSGVARIVPEAAATEAFAWIGVGFLSGSSLGSALGGLTVDVLGARATFLLAAALPTVLALLLLVRGRTSALVADEPLPS